MIARTVAPLLLVSTIAFAATSEWATFFVIETFHSDTTREAIKNERDLRENLDVVDREVLRRIEIKRVLIADLIAGRTTLAAMAEQFLVMNRAYPEYMVVIRSTYPGSTDEEITVSNVMGYVTGELSYFPVEHRAEVLARLSAELECFNCTATEADSTHHTNER